MFSTDPPIAGTGCSRVERGRAPTFDELYNGHYNGAWRLARRLGVTPAALEDVLQEVFLVVFRRLDSFDPASNARAWISGIVLNVVRTHRRTGRRRPAHEELSEALPSAQCGPHEALERRESVALLDRVLDTLDDKHREVLVLTECEGLTGPEVAAVVGIPVDTAYSRLRLARREFVAAHRRVAGRLP